MELSLVDLDSVEDDGEFSSDGDDGPGTSEQRQILDAGLEAQRGDEAHAARRSGLAEDWTVAKNNSYF